MKKVELVVHSHQLASLSGRAHTEGSLCSDEETLATKMCCIIGHWPNVTSSFTSQTFGQVSAFPTHSSCNEHSYTTNR